MTDTITQHLNATPAVAQPRTIADFLSGEPEANLCVRLAIGQLDTVVLARKPLQPNVVLISPGFDLPISEIPADTAATPITDPQRCRHLLRQALTAAGTQFIAARSTIEEHRREAATFRHDVRQYAIARYRTGEIC